MSKAIIQFEIGICSGNRHHPLVSPSDARGEGSDRIRLFIGGVQQCVAARRAVGVESVGDAAVSVARGAARAALGRVRARAPPAPARARRVQPYAYSPVCVPRPAAPARALHTAHAARHRRCVRLRRTPEHNFHRAHTQQNSPDRRIRVRRY